MKKHLLGLAAVAALSGGFMGSASICFAADKPAAKSKADNRPKWAKMDYGPFLTASIISDPRGKFDNDAGAFTGDSTARGIAIRLSDGWKDGVAFDMDLMRVSAGWIDGGLTLTGLISDGNHGPGPTISKPPTFQTPHLPGWADASGSFKDPRPDTIAPLAPPGLLPRTWAKYNGLYRHGQQVVLSYEINGAPVLESPGVESAGASKAISRTIHIEKSTTPQAIMIADVNPQYPYPTAEKKTNLPPTAKTSGGSVEGNSATLGDLHIAVVAPPAGAKLEIINDTQLVLRLPASAAATEFKILIGAGGEAGKGAFGELVKASAAPADLVPMTKGGPALWKETIETKGTVSPAKDQAYVVDTLTLPDQNPYDAWMRIGAFDFFPDGKSAALSTWSGDVWIVSGISEGLEHLTWKRFATGLHQPLGLKIVDNTIYTVGHDQITRLKDLDGDGEADFYENFNNDWKLTTAFHAFGFDLQTDPEGNFFFAFGSPVHTGGRGFQKITDDHGCILKVSKDGSKIEHYATGLRAPNGLSVGPHGEVTVGDNEGTWVPTSPLHWVKPGQFLGVTDSAHELKDKVAMPKPLLWLSHNGGIDNSCGGQVWVTSDKWGPFQGELLCMSYGQSRLFHVMKEEVNGQMQGAAAAFPLKFTSSVMRGRFNPSDGQLYIAGLKGWQTNAAKDGGFDRVRFTGAPVRMPQAFHVKKTGVAITFTCELDAASVADAGNFDVQAWNYQWTSNYGSPEVSTLDDPAKPNKAAHRDTLVIKSAKLLPDKKTVFLEIQGIKPVNQMQVNYNIAGADKAPLKDSIFSTIHNLGADEVSIR